MYRFRTGDRIKPSAEGLRTFPRWIGREGVIIGLSRDGNVWEVRWDGSAKIECIHESFIVLASHKAAEIKFGVGGRARA